jgi:hypothetical protein
VSFAGDIDDDDEHNDDLANSSDEEDEEEEEEEEENRVDSSDTTRRSGNECFRCGGLVANANFKTYKIVDDKPKQIYFCGEDCMKNWNPVS